MLFSLFARFLKDKRSPAQKDVEKAMGMQIVVPQRLNNNEVVFPDIQHLAIGEFVNGEFVPLKDVTLQTILSSKYDDESAQNMIKQCIETSMTKTKLTTNRWDRRRHTNFDIYIAYPFEKVTMGKDNLYTFISSGRLSDDIIGDKKVLYIVNTIYLADSIKIQYENEPRTTNSKSILKSGCVANNSKQTKVWGYELLKFKVKNNQLVKPKKELKVY